MLLEARTYSPAAPASSAESLCGYFQHLSLPQADFERASVFWERGGFVALPQLDEPYPHLPLTSDHIDLAFHQRRSFDAPLLVFECVDVAATMLRLYELDVTISKELPRGLSPKTHCLIESPEGTALLMAPTAD